MDENDEDSSDPETSLLQRLERELRTQERSSPLPPWLKHPEIPRYSIGWRMGYGEDYLTLWWHWANERSKDEKIAYFREFAPIQVDWIDWVGMQLVDEQDHEDSSSDDETISFGELIQKSGEAIAHLGLYDINAWQEYLKKEADKRRGR